jgi:hypothetical protein
MKRRRQKQQKTGSWLSMTRGRIWKIWMVKDKEEKTLVVRDKIIFNGK